MSNEQNRGALAKALAAAQGKMPEVPKKRVAKVKSKRTGVEFSYNYADISDVLAAAIPVLSEHGIAVLQPTEVRDDGRTILRTVLIHESGESMESTFPLPHCDDAQELGSALTYARRYALCALAAIASDDDDDGAQTKSQPKQRRDEERSGGGSATGWRKAAKPGTCEDCSTGFGADGGYYRYDENDTFHAICAPCASRRTEEAKRAEDAA